MDVKWRWVAALCAGALLAGCTPSVGESSAQSSPGPQSPESPPAASPTPEPDPLQEHWHSMSTEEQVASVLMLHYPGTDADATADFVGEFHPGGLILMGDNIPEDEAILPESIQEWNDDEDFPLVIAVDEEGGIVSRLPSDTYPAAADLRDGPVADTADAFAARARLLQERGITMNFGIIADTTSDPDSFMWPRVLGSTPEASADEVRAAVEAEDGLVASTLKHFPGHGLTAEDSHSGVPISDVTYEEWRSGAALPFEAGIDAGAEAVMVGHLAFPQIAEGPASLSPRWYQVLRTDLGFDGVIVTDDMRMLLDSGLPEYADRTGNAVAALNAGATLVLEVSGNNGDDATAEAEDLIDGLAEAVRSGEVDSAALEEAGMRMLEFRDGLR